MGGIGILPMGHGLEAHPTSFSSFYFCGGSRVGCTDSRLSTMNDEARMSNDE